MRAINKYLCQGAIVTLLVVFAGVTAPAFSTGVPVEFSIAPATIRQQNKDEGSAVATVTLKAPSPTFFVCQIRSNDPEKISFSTIIFKKGQVQGTAAGVVHWLRILKDGTIKLSAFSVDAPGEKLWFTVGLKVKDEKQPVDAPGQEP